MRRVECDDCGQMTEFTMGRTLCSDCRGVVVVGELYSVADDGMSFEVVERRDDEYRVEYEDGYTTTFDVDDLEDKVRSGDIVEGYA